MSILRYIAAAAAGAAAGGGAVAMISPRTSVAPLGRVFWVPVPNEEQEPDGTETTVIDLAAWRTLLRVARPAGARVFDMAVGPVEVNQRGGKGNNTYGRGDDGPDAFGERSFIIEPAGMTPGPRSSKERERQRSLSRFLGELVTFGVLAEGGWFRKWPTRPGWPQGAHDSPYFRYAERTGAGT